MRWYWWAPIIVLVVVGMYDVWRYQRWMAGDREPELRYPVPEPNFLALPVLLAIMASVVLTLITMMVGSSIKDAGRALFNKIKLHSQR